MSGQGVEIFAKSVATNHLSDDPLVANHISNRILKADENSKTESERAEATKANKIPSTGVVEAQDDLLHDEIAESLIHMMLTAYRSDFFPVLLLLAIYTLVAFGAALFLLMGWIVHMA